MHSRKLAICIGAAAATLLAVGTANEAAFAQPASGVTATNKAEAKAARKAERKQARAKKNAELSTLEKNGYSPQSPQEDYPQDAQRAQSKALGATAPSAAAKTVPPPGQGE